MNVFLLLLGSNIIIVASVSNFKSNNQTSTSDNGVPYKRNIQRVEPLERMRRLIPYMTFYIPTPNREYLPTAPYGHRQTVIQNDCLLVLSHQIDQTNRRC